MGYGYGVAVSCGVGQQLQLRFDPEPGNLYMLQVRPESQNKQTTTKKNPSRCRGTGLIPGLAERVKRIQPYHSCGVGQSLPWEFTYASGGH